MSEKILIIEDDINILSALQAKLAIEGFETATEDSNDEQENIMARMRVFGPDFIIMDIVLPRLDGAKLLYAIRAEEEGRKIPVFVFTDVSDEDTRAMSAKLGANYYFLKTDLNIDDFVGKVKKIIRNLMGT